MSWLILFAAWLVLVGIVVRGFRSLRRVAELERRNRAEAEWLCWMLREEHRRREESAIPPLCEWPTEALERLAAAAWNAEAFEEEMAAQRLAEWLEEHHAQGIIERRES